MIKVLRPHTVGQFFHQRLTQSSAQRRCRIFACGQRIAVEDDLGWRKCPVTCDKWKSFISPAHYTTHDTGFLSALAKTEHKVYFCAGES